MMKKDVNIIKRPIDNRASIILTENEQKALNAWGLSLNEFAAYRLRVLVPLTFKLKGLSRDSYHITLKTDIPGLAIKRAKQIKAVTKRFFGEQLLVIDGVSNNVKNDIYQSNLNCYVQNWSSL